MPRIRACLLLAGLMFGSAQAPAAESAGPWIENDWPAARRAATAGTTPRPIFVVFR